MKKIVVAFTLIFLGISAFSQKTSQTKPGSKGAVNIDIPNFADPAIKRFYEAETNYLKKAIIAIRNNDEATLRKLNKEEAREKEALRQQIKSKPTPDDVKKKQAWNKQAMPYIMEMQQSELIKRLEQEEDRKTEKMK